LIQAINIRFRRVLGSIGADPISPRGEYAPTGPPYIRHDGKPISRSRFAHEKIPTLQKTSIQYFII